MFLLLGGRLYYLQLIEGKKFRMLSEKNRIAVHCLPAVRGDILDRNGVTLATQRKVFCAVLSRIERRHPVFTLLKPLIKPLALTPQDVETICAFSEHSQDGRVVIKPMLTWREVAWLETNRNMCPHVSIEDGQIRFYPFREESAALIGYVGPNTDQSTKIAGTIAGKSGIENAYEEELQGEPGNRSVEIDARRRIVRQLDYLTPKKGESLSLSIDYRIQRFLWKQLMAFRRAACVVLDVRTGEVVGMGSVPSFDPNLFSKKISLGAWKSLTNSPDHPLINRAVGGLYPPASTIKIAMALIGLKLGLIDEDTQIQCTGVFPVGTHAFHCWRRGGHGKMNLLSALTESCDTFFYHLALKMKTGIPLALFQELGLAELFLAQLPESRKGLIPSPDWKSSTWTAGDSLLTSIGQGACQTTPLQLAVMAARVATGMRIIPALTREEISPADPLLFPKAHLELVRRALYRVVHHPSGTAFKARGSEELAGKTGTGQVRSISKSQRLAGNTKTLDLPWEMRDHSLFCGYAPSSSPRYSISVILEHGVTGAYLVARDIMREVMRILG